MKEHFDWALGQAEKANRQIRERRLEQQDVADSDKQQTQPAERTVPQPQHDQPTEHKDEGPPPEKNKANWRRMLHLPDDRHQVDERDREVKEPQREQKRETPQQARPAGDQPEKKAGEREVDWRRSLTEPGYSHEIREQERAERLERAGEQRQEQGQEVEVREPQHHQTHETPQQAGPAGDRPERKPEEKEVDWRRALTDPDYSREIREQARAEGLERTREQSQEQGMRRASAGHEL
jgi:hypothetical protein